MQPILPTSSYVHELIIPLCSCARVEWFSSRCSIEPTSTSLISRSREKHPPFSIPPHQPDRNGFLPFIHPLHSFRDPGQSRNQHPTFVRQDSFLPSSISFHIDGLCIHRLELSIMINCSDLLHSLHSFIGRREFLSFNSFIRQSMCQF